MADGLLTVLVEDEHRVFSRRSKLPDHGISIPEMEPRMFSFNAPQGACETCNGLGRLEDFNLDKLLNVDVGLMDFLTVLEDDVRPPSRPESLNARPSGREARHRPRRSLQEPQRRAPRRTSCSVPT